MYEYIILICIIILIYQIYDILSTVFKYKKFLDKIHISEKKRNENIFVIVDENNYRKLKYNIFIRNYVKSIEDTYGIINKINNLSLYNKNKKINIIIHCKGGSIQSSDILIKIIFLSNNIIAHVPSYACSAGTLIALVTKKIYINRFAYLT